MPFARITDPVTSHEAAESVDNVSETQKYILKALNHPRTDPDLAEAYLNLKGSPRASLSGIRSRRAELVAKGLVKDTGDRVKLESGRRAIVWAVA
jgi:hypothetical protein